MLNKPEVYDKIYKDNLKYGCHYSDSIYYPIWDAALKYISGRVLEFGCGTGQFAEMLHKKKEKEVMYLGVDFSQEAILQAKKRNYGMNFLCDDVFNIYIPLIDTLVAFELLEHIEQDVKLVKRFPKDKKIVFSVPNFSAANHYRYFTNKSDIKKRYGAIKIDKIEEFHLIKNKHGATNTIFLCVGRKR